MTEAERLLLEWLTWWRDSDEAPAKLPKALHIRTAMLLVTKHPDHMGVRSALGV